MSFLLGLVPVLGSGDKEMNNTGRTPILTERLFQQVLVLCDPCSSHRNPLHSSGDVPTPTKDAHALSPQVLSRSSPSRNQSLHKDVQGLHFIEPRKSYPHSHLREPAAIISITHRGVHIREESRWWASLQTPRLNHTCSKDPLFYQPQPQVYCALN